jgi:hypothetical protein
MLVPEKRPPSYCWLAAVPSEAFIWRSTGALLKKLSSDSLNK